MRSDAFVGFSRMCSAGRVLALTGVIALGLAGCESLGDNAPPQSKEYVPVEFAMPPDSTVDRGATIALGDSQQWYGTLTLNTGQTLDQVHQFYSNALAAQGWEPLSSLIADKVVLQFVNRKRGRACIISIEKKGGLLGDTWVQIIVSPLTGPANG